MKIIVQLVTGGFDIDDLPFMKILMAILRMYLYSEVDKETIGKEPHIFFWWGIPSLLEDEYLPLGMGSKSISRKKKSITIFHHVSHGTLKLSDLASSISYQFAAYRDAVLLAADKFKLAKIDFDADKQIKLLNEIESTAREELIR